MVLQVSALSSSVVSFLTEQHGKLPPSYLKVKQVLPFTWLSLERLNPVTSAAVCQQTDRTAVCRCFRTP